MDDLSSKERLTINAIPEGEAGFRESTRKTPTEQQDLNSGQLENAESSPNHRPPILARDADPATRLFQRAKLGTCAPVGEAFRSDLSMNPNVPSKKPINLSVKSSAI